LSEKSEKWAPSTLTDQLLSIRSDTQDDRRLGADASDIAAGIARIFHDLFNVEVGNDDDFFDLGGDSLAGETLLSGIERDFGIALPLSILLESSTPRALAAAIAAKLQSAQSTILFTVSDAGSQTPLFCIHGHTGSATFARKLRDVLPDRPIYAVRALGLLPGELPLASVPEMASRYIREIRRVRPSGPYHIFGQCTIATAAYEVAQQLSAAGAEVKTVTLADPLRLKRRSGIRRFYYSLAVKRAIRTALRFPEMSGDERWQKIAEPAMEAVRKTYEARPYSGRVMIVAASYVADEILHPKSYPALVPHLETVVVEGKHHDVFTGPDGKVSDELARAMSSFLARHD
jgi:thioesterase domain-containing protein/acyl carrier protein